MQVTIAKLISRLFDIYLILPLSILFVHIKLAEAGVNSSILNWWDSIFVFFYLIVPFAAYLFSVLRHQVHDWDFADRVKRIPVEIACLFAFLGLFFLTIVFNAPALYTALALINYIVMLCIVGITEYWKISVHSALTTVCVCFAIVLFGFPMIPVLLFLPVVYWARMQLKMHTLYQLLYASLIAAPVTFLVLKFFHY